MSATTFNYHFVLPPDLMCQTRELPIFPKRTNEETDIKVTIKKDRDWPIKIVVLLIIITVGTATYALNSYFANKSKPAQRAHSLVKPSISTTPLQSKVKETTPVTLKILKIESLPSTNVTTIAADAPSKVETKTDGAQPTSDKTGSTNIIRDIQKVAKREIPKPSSSIAKHTHVANIEKLPISLPSLKEIEESTLPLTTPKFIVETQPTKVQKGGIFKRPSRPETTEASSKAPKATEKADSTPQSLF